MANPQIGEIVEYVDHHGKPHKAIVTANWSGGQENGAINLVFVSADDAKTDQYGRQIERDTSVVHKSRQTAPGNFWYQSLTED